MVGKIIDKGKKLITGPQSSILSAATIIMFMIVASRLLGLVRQRTLAHFFTPEEISLFFAAFRLPDTIFEVLVFGTFSSAFIPVFAKIVDKNRNEAWRLAGVVSNIGIVIFALLSALLILSAEGFYSLTGYSFEEKKQIVKLTKLLFTAQGFFVLSYVLTGVLESMRRFLVPALAPIFYNLGIIAGIVFLSHDFGLMAPVVGVLIGAVSHFLVQLPLAVKLGYRFVMSFRIDKNVKKIGKLAAPRIIELTFSQTVKFVELYLASFISTAAYAYYYLGNTLQLLPVGLFGTSIAKAALPSLSKESANLEKFRKSFLSSFYQLIFLVAPFAATLIVLRIPIVRLVYGTEIFDWESTVQTGKVVSAFGAGIVFQASVALLARAFYALHDTKTPVSVSILSMFFMIIMNFVFIRGVNLPVWGLAAAFSLGSIFQASVLFYLLMRRIGEAKFIKLLGPIFQSALASFCAGAVMFFMLKIFDRSVWVKRLSFLGQIEISRNIPFERFVLDTRFTVNLLVLTLVVSFFGVIIYLGLSIILKSNEVWTFFNLVKRLVVKHKISPIPKEEKEPIAPVQSDLSS